MNRALADCLRYNRWANLNLIDSCRALTDEQLDAPAPGSSRSVRELFQHMVGAELTFVLRTKGVQDLGEQRQIEGSWSGFDRLREVAGASGDDLIEIAEGLDENGLVALPYQGKTYEYPKSFFLLHAIEHGVEHRTEIKVTLALVGIKTPDLDGWFYAPAAGYGREIAKGADPAAGRGTQP